MKEEYLYRMIHICTYTDVAHKFFYHVYSMYVTEISLTCIMYYIYNFIVLFFTVYSYLGTHKTS